VKITNLSWLLVRPSAADAHQPIHLLRISTDTGAVSLAEALVPSTDHLDEAVGLFEPLLVDRPVRARGQLWEQMAGTLQAQKWPLSEYAGALGAVDMALWDLAAQAYAVPLYQLLGGAYFSSVDTYALAPWVLGEAQQLLGWLASGVEQTVGGIGITIKQVNPESLRAVERIREEIGTNRRLMLQVVESCSDTESAQQAAEQLEKMELFWCENLLPSTQAKAYARLRTSTDVPLAAGRDLYGIKQFYELVKAQAVDVVVVDLRYCGVTVARRVADLARLEGMRVAFAGGASPLTTLAAAHLSASCPVAMPLGLPADFAAGRGDLFVTSAQFTDGFVTLGDEPGLGGELKLDHWEVQKPDE